MSFYRFAILIPVGLLTIHAAAWAADRPKPQANEMIEPTCGDLMAALRMADPGERPSSKRKIAAEDAQDDIATALFWLHGWQTARGETSVPVKRDWMAAELKRVVAACKAQSPNGAALISTVATK